MGLKFPPTLYIFFRFVNDKYHSINKKGETKRERGHNEFTYLTANRLHPRGKLIIHIL